MSEEVKENTAEENKAGNESPASEQAVQPSLNSVYGFKKGMSAIYNEEGQRIAVTVLECHPWTVTELKTDERDGYKAVQIGYKTKKAKNCSKAEMGQAKKLKLESDFQFKKEVRCDELPEDCSLGVQVGLGNFEVGTKVQVTSKSKGRGFSGAMKRHGFGGGPASHGSGFHRKPGSIGMCTFPGRVMPGKKMPGQYGNKNKTIKGLEVVGVNQDENVLLVKGSVPGSLNSLVKVSLSGVKG